MPHKDLEARKKYHQIYYREHCEEIKERSRIYGKTHPRKRRKDFKNRLWCKLEDKPLWKKLLRKWYHFVHNGPTKYVRCQSLAESKSRKDANRRKYRRTEKFKARRRVKRVIAHKKRYAVDIEYRLACCLRGRLSRLMSIHNFRKSRSMLNLLGCTLEFFKTYMASKFTEGMSFDNHGEWHIDHEAACRKFTLTNPDHQRACFHFSNLQPLWGEDNVGKDSLSVPKLTDVPLALAA